MDTVIVILHEDGRIFGIGIVRTITAIIMEG